MHNDDGFEYIESLPITIGGVSGLYSVLSPGAQSSQWSEYTLLAASTSDGAGQYVAVISDKNGGITNQFPYTNAQQYGLDSNGDGTYVYGMPIRMGPTNTIFPNDHWHRIANSERKVFINITAPSSNVMYVTLKMRVKKLEKIPAPMRTVHPEHGHLMNKEREETINQRLDELGIPNFARSGNNGK